MQPNLEHPTSGGVLEHLRTEQSWEDMIRAEVKKLPFHALNRDSFEGLEEQLLFADLPEAERRLHIESLGRIIQGMMNFGSPHHLIERMRYELNLLKDGLQGREIQIEPFVDLFVLHFARESDSNFNSGFPEVSSRLLKRLSQQLAQNNDTETLNLLLNPFHLSDGEEIVAFDRTTGETRRITIDVLIDETSGAVAYGDTESEDLEKFNMKLARGTYMKKDGSNYFGGLMYLEDEYHVRELTAGSTVILDDKLPFEKESNPVAYEIADTNQAELETKYGNAYLAFMENNNFKDPLKVSLKKPDGSASPLIDVRHLRFAN